MNTPIIEIKNIGKKYNITHQRGGYISLRDVVMNVLKSPFSFLKTKAKQVAGLQNKEEFWALKDINFSVKRGEVIGIIGANGAGKSTLLKILSQITPPTEGEIKIRGRVGSLLEVGTGFHPELTGRENIFLNGAILGMTKKEIAEKFDKIVEFAGIEKFLDTVVKHYSSGMYVRLAFSVAAHMNHDILIIDEVLAVGDAEFQKKCLGKMDEITKKEGRTILFVSHNIAAIQTLCTRTFLLDNGKIVDSGNTKKVIDRYNEIISSRLSNLTNISVQNRVERSHVNKASFSKVVGISANEEENKLWTFRYTEDLRFKIECKIKEPSIGLAFFMKLTDITLGTEIGNLKMTITKQNLKPGEIVAFTVHIPKNTIKPGRYNVYLALGDAKALFWYDVIDNNVNIPTLTIQSTSDIPDENSGFVTIPSKVTDVKVDSSTKL